MITLVMPDLVGVLAATIASFLIGAVWFAPQVLGKVWMTALGKSQEDFNKNRNKAVVIGLVANLVTAYLLGVLIATLGSANAMDGVEVALLAWLGFPAMVHLTSYFFEMRPAKLFAIDASHTLVIFAVMGAILGMWG